MVKMQVPSNKNINPYKSIINLASIILFSFLLTINTFAQFGYIESPFYLTVTEHTGDKPQSKVWNHAGKWWAVLPISSGTYVWRLDNNAWTQILELTSDDDTQADCVVNGDTTHILLYRGETNNRLVSIQYVPASGAYQLWSVQSDVIDIDLDSGVETAVIDIDQSGIMWLANDGTSQIYVRWSGWPYDTWSNTNRYQLNSSRVDDDDICDITTFGGNKMGVLWSDQRSDEKFYFRYHTDGDAGNDWSTRETAASGSSGGGVADDHINFAVDGGIIYAAIKTGYDASGYIRLGLLRRLANGTWNLYQVTEGAYDGTRPIALLNTSEETIKVIYTASQNGDDIVYREANTSDLNSFGSEQTLISGSYDNVTSTKQNFTDEVVILASNDSTQAVGVMAYTDDPFPVELAFFSGVLNSNEIELWWRTETEVNNYGFDIERSSPWLGTIWETIGFIEGHGNSNSPKEYSYADTNIKQSGNYYYRLKQMDNDGTYEYSDVVSVDVGVPDNFYLSQNYPNPFNPETSIEFTLPGKQFVSLRVYNTLGELVGELVNEERQAGSYSVIFNASNLPSGVYIYRLQTSDFAENKKMTLLK
jgi:hypothetical protein